MGQARSMERNAFLFGYSLPRILVGLVFLVLVAGILTLVLVGSLRPLKFRSMHGSIDRWIERDTERALRMALLLLGLALLGGYALVLFGASLVPKTPYILRVAVDRILPCLIWLALAIAQFAVLMCAQVSAIRRSLNVPAESPGTSVLLAVLLTGVSAQWLTFALRAEWLYQIPGWFYVWRRTPQPMLPSLAYLVPASIAALVVVRTLLHLPQARTRTLLALMLLCSGLQFAYGIARGGGMEGFRSKYANSPVSIQTQYACDAESIAGVFRDYEAKYGGTFWLGTKPPGFLSFHVGLRDMLRWMQPQLMQEACFNTMTWFYAAFFPILAATVLVPMAGLEGEWESTNSASAAGFLYLAVPSVVLIPMVLDQALFPIVATLCILATVRAVRLMSLGWGILAGALAVAATVLSFSLLPLMAFVLAYPTIEMVAHKGEGGTSRPLKVFIGLLAGFVTMLALAHFAFGYDPLARYEAAFRQHREIKEFTSSLGGVLWSVILNNVEITHLFGFPVVLLFFVQSLRSAAALIKHVASRFDTFVAGIAVMYIGMNIVGQTRGEVARLWLFFVPLMCVVAIESAPRLLRTRSRSIAFFVALELVSTALAHFYLLGGKPV
jgi:hypothetical protein